MRLFEIFEQQTLDDLEGDLFHYYNRMKNPLGNDPITYSAKYRNTLSTIRQKYGASAAERAQDNAEMKNDLKKTPITVEPDDNPPNSDPNTVSGFDEPIIINSKTAFRDIFYYQNNIVKLRTRLTSRHTKPDQKDQIKDMLKREMAEARSELSGSDYSLLATIVYRYFEKNIPLPMSPKDIKDQYSATVS